MMDEESGTPTKYRKNRSFGGNNNNGNTLSGGGGGGVVVGATTTNKLTFFPLLIMVAMIFYILGFIQSIRGLPEITNALSQQHHHGRQHETQEEQFGGTADGTDSNSAVSPSLSVAKGSTIRNRLMVPMAPLLGGFSSAGGNNNSPKIGKEEQEAINTGLIKLPPSNAKWPISVRDETSRFIDIPHPAADPSEGITLNVPQFWSDPIMTNDGPLMSREVANMVGTYDVTNGKMKGSLDSRTIFIAIASYRDYQCRTTVESIFKRAKYPERVRVAVVDQIEEGIDVSCNDPEIPCSSNPNQALCKWKDRIDVYEMEASLAIGPVFARHIGHRLYRGEYYAMQIDAHVTFVQDWDVDVISQLESTGNDMAVLSTYLTDIVGSIDPDTGKSLRHTRPIMCNTDYEPSFQGAHLRHLSQPEREPPIHGTPQLQPYWAAGWSFSRGHFVVNVPYDVYLPMIFQGEESSIGIRSFTFGYDHYAPERSVCFHTYAEGVNKVKRNNVPKFWDNGSKYSGSGVKAMKRLLGIIGMIPEEDPSTWNHAEMDRYGVGSVRPISKFFNTFGIDIHRKKCQKHLCSFVQGGDMHKQFVRNLRRDGMGIDYNKINFEFQDPRPGQP